MRVVDDLTSIQCQSLFQFYMSYFILLYKFISCVYINSTYNYHKLYFCGVVAFVPLYHIYYCLFQHPVGLFFDPCKDHSNVSKDKDKMDVGVGCTFDTDAHFH